MRLNVALAEVCGSTVEKGGVAGAEFSADVTFSQWFCSLINVCSSLQSLLCLCERNAVLQGKIAFESCNSVFVGKTKYFLFGGGGARNEARLERQMCQGPPSQHTQTIT